MTLSFALALIAVRRTEAPVALPVGKDFYVPGPALRLGTFVTSEKFSRDGQFLSFIDERPEGNYVAERALLSQGEETAMRTIVRVDLKKGIRQVLYTQQAGETLIRIEPVGPSGDIIFTTTIGVTQGVELRWKAIYCPVGGSPRVVASDEYARSFDVVSSETESEAFILCCGPSGPAKFLFLSAESTVQKSLSVTAFQGGFFLRTRSGNSVAFLQGPGPTYPAMGTFECNYVTGEVRALETMERPFRKPEITPIIAYKSVDRSKGDASLGQVPLLDIFATAGSNPTDPKLLVAQGVIVSVTTSPNGLAFTYLAPDGHFLKEMVKAAPS